MAAKSPYVCLIYEVGDEVVSKYPPNDKVGLVVKIEFAKLSTGTPYQMLWLDYEDSFPVVSSHYVPAGKSIERYKEGVPTYGYSNVKVKPERQASRVIENKQMSVKQTISFNPSAIGKFGKFGQVPTDEPFDAASYPVFNLNLTSKKDDT